MSNRTLEGVDDKRLAEMWCELNRWGWPKEIPGPQTGDIRHDLMALIVRKIGRRKCMEEWNKDR